MNHLTIYFTAIILTGLVILAFMGIVRLFKPLMCSYQLQIKFAGSQAWHTVTCKLSRGQCFDMYKEYWIGDERVTDFRVVVL